MNDKLIGERLIELLGLKVKANGRVDTSVGDKTPVGLSRTVNSLFVEHLFDEYDEKQQHMSLLDKISNGESPNFSPIR